MGGSATPSSSDALTPSHHRRPTPRRPPTLIVERRLRTSVLGVHRMQYKHPRRVAGRQIRRREGQTPDLVERGTTRWGRQSRRGSALVRTCVEIKFRAPLSFEVHAIADALAHGQTIAVRRVGDGPDRPLPLDGRPHRR